MTNSSLTNTFFEKFELFADAPCAVAKFRELVLELAVQGKLTQQLLGDDSVEKLLQMVHAEKVSLVNDGLLKKAERIESFSDNLQLPSQWRYAPLSALCVSVTDGDHLPPPKAETGVPFLVISDVRWGGIEFTGCRRVSEEYYAKLEWIRKPQERDILYTLVGSFGIPVVVRDSQPFCVQRHIGILRPSKHIELQYLAYALESKLVFRQASLVATGIAQKTVPLAGLRKIVIPVPPLAEQKRIVAKVDELMALCDRLEAQQQERETRHATLARASLARFADAPTQANLQFLFHLSYTIDPADLRKSILTLAVQGKLVPQDPNDEPAEELIGRIATIRDAKKAKQYEAVSADEVPFEVPSSWAWVRLGNISLTSDSGWSPQCLSEARSGTEWGVLKVSAVSWGVFKPEENKALPPGMASRPDCEVKAGDFLLSRANTEELVARSVVVDQTPPRLMMSDKIVRFTFPDEIERAFINLANSSGPSRDYYARNASGTSSSMKNIGREVMCNLPIALPPLAEQRRIVSKVEELMALVDELETQLAASRATGSRLLDAIVAEVTALD